MFTGLIKTTGEIRRVDQRGDRVIAVAMREPFAAEPGDSIAVNGICLTVIKIDGNVFKASLSEATLACTTAGNWAVGTRVNLEPSLRVGDAMGGHFVSGHVDGIARATQREKSGDSTVWEFEVPASLARFIAPKGSITIDGVSLTVNAVGESRVESRESSTALSSRRTPGSTCSTEEDRPRHKDGVTNLSVLVTRHPSPATTFTVNIIPHTADATGFKTLAPGDAVNIEIDMLARYVARLKEFA